MYIFSCFDVSNMLNNHFGVFVWLAGSHGACICLHAYLMQLTCCEGYYTKDPIKGNRLTAL